MKIDDGLPFPVFQPEIAGNPCVVFIGLAVALTPVIELTGPDAQPLNEPAGADLGFLRPAPDEIDDQLLEKSGAGQPRTRKRPRPILDTVSF
jgi:hypothetical protein